MIPLFESERELRITRLIIATYLLGQMLDTPANSTPEKTAKERKVSAAFEYADLLMERFNG